LDNVPLAVVEALSAADPLAFAGLLAHVASYMDADLGNAAATLLRVQLKGQQ
jgi:hypothetical protein